MFWHFLIPKLLCNYSMKIKNMVGSERLETEVENENQTQEIKTK